jgi:hypothetical protein
MNVEILMVILLMCLGKAIRTNLDGAHNLKMWFEYDEEFCSSSKS